MSSKFIKKEVPSSLKEFRHYDYKFESLMATFDFFFNWTKVIV